MQDQVHKINGLSDRPIATFLGSGQEDSSAERRALDGDYNLIYITPEKLGSPNFMSCLARLHDKKQIILFAVDEAHCVSEWGHDFRPDFRRVGQVLRGTDSALKHVPILALTATAVPRVQDDIITSLSMRDKYLKLAMSFDRTNLKIKIATKTGGLAKTLKPLLDALNDASLRRSQQSTIVYAPTRNDVESVAAFLRANVDVTVAAYHAGCSTEVRSRVHTEFLTGKATVMVATLAFGMGIDKPDIRRVIHYGPPKTVEEYYQQIGRYVFSLEC
jgi:RecQ family ATP-dependent DNA helicase